MWFPYQAIRTRRLPVVEGLRAGPVAQVAGLGAALGAIVFLLGRQGMIDDSYITMDYARSLALHGEWALEPGHPANTATSPLNVLMLAAVTLVVRSPVAAVGIVLVASTAVTGAVLARLAPRPVALLAVALVVGSPLLVSTVGMETYPAVALVALLAWAVTDTRARLVGLVAGLLVLCRPDLVAFGLAALLVPVLCAQDRRLAIRTVLATAAAVAVPWFVASWWFLGSALPDTALLKVGEHWGRWSFGDGPALYLQVYPAAVVLSAVPAVAGAAVAVVALVRRLPVSPLVAVWGVGAMLHAAVYLLLDPAPFHWYYGPAVGALTMLAVLVLGRDVRGLAAGLGLLAVTAGFLAQRDWQTAPITTNWATSSQYAAAAAAVPPGAVVRSPGEIGTLAFFCDCTVVDQFSDRALIDELRGARAAEGGSLTRAVMDLNYARLRTGPPLAPTLQFVYADDGPGTEVGTPWRSGRLRVEPVRAG